MNHIPARPDPDAILARMKARDERAGRGRLKVFLGACAGVGKTYTMLEAARAHRAEGLDVVAGLVESHGRAETEAQLRWLEELPRREVEHRGVRLLEFDLDGALLRRPRLLLVDELAHTNAPGSRHLKRWQDVKELLAGGVDVYTTMNIQHLESLNDVVAQITGRRVQETVPDSFLEAADAIELVDLPLEELLKRFREGKVYLPEQAALAQEQFFRPANISALRELALRFVADRVNQQVQDLCRERSGTPHSPTAERILVLVGPNPSSAWLVRHACRLAKSLRCGWIALNVETMVSLHPAPREESPTAVYLRMAARLGAETVTVPGVNLAETTLDFARQRHVTRIIVGKPRRRGPRDWIFGSVSDQIVRRSGTIAVIVTQGDPEEDLSPASPARRRTGSEPWRHFLLGAGMVALCTALCLPLRGLLEPSNLTMVYLLGVIVVALRYGRGPAVLASILSVGAFDFFLIPPHFTFAVANRQFISTFVVMLVVGLVISTLTVRLREAVERSRLREERTASLHALSRKLAMLRGQESILGATVGHIAELFDSEVIALLPDAGGKLHVRAGTPPGADLDAKERGVAQWVHDLGQMAGRGTETVPSAERLYVPLLASHCSFGALGLRARDPLALTVPEQLQLLEAMAQLAALALEVDRLTGEAQEQRVQIDTERLRNALLSSVSHDLRTPLAAITGAASSLLEDRTLPDAGRRELLRTISEEAERLSQQVGNLLEMSRLQTGTLAIRKELQPVEEAMGAACRRLDRLLRGRPVEIDVPQDLPMVPADCVLLERVFFNLLENAAKYTPPGSPIGIAARQEDDSVTVEIRDRGPGLALGEEEKVFEKFYRGAGSGRTGGTGLGLAICRGIVEAHGGRIRAAARTDGPGSVFSFSLPLGMERQASATGGDA